MGVLMKKGWMVLALISVFFVARGQENPSRFDARDWSVRQEIVVPPGAGPWVVFRPELDTLHDATFELYDLRVGTEDGQEIPFKKINPPPFKLTRREIPLVPVTGEEKQWFVDLGDLPFEHHRLVMVPARPDPFGALVQVYTSEDNEDYEAWGDPALLFRKNLHFENLSVEYPPTTRRYLRLKITILGDSRNIEPKRALVFQWRNHGPFRFEIPVVLGSSEKSSHGGGVFSIFFPSNHIPARELNLSLEGEVAPVEVQTGEFVSGSNGGERFHPYGEGWIWRHSVEGWTQQNSPIKVDTVRGDTLSLRVKGIDPGPLKEGLTGTLTCEAPLYAFQPESEKKYYLYFGCKGVEEAHYPEMMSPPLDRDPASFPLGSLGMTTPNPMFVKDSPSFMSTHPRLLWGGFIAAIVVFLLVALANVFGGKR